jgi:hypothetical protein
MIREKHSAAPLIIFISATLLFYVFGVERIEIFLPAKAVESVLFGYLAMSIFINAPVFRHWLRLCTDGQYRIRARKYGLGKKYRFVMYPQKMRNDQWSS